MRPQRQSDTHRERDRQDTALPRNHEPSVREATRASITPIFSPLSLSLSLQSALRVVARTMHVFAMWCHVTPSQPRQIPFATIWPRASWCRRRGAPWAAVAAPHCGAALQPHSCCASRQGYRSCTCYCLCIPSVQRWRGCWCKRWTWRSGLRMIGKCVVSLTHVRAWSAPLGRLRQYESGLATGMSQQQHQQLIFS